MSIRLRLTLLYSAILALTLIVLGAMLYGGQARLTLRDEAQVIADMAQRIVELRQAGFPLDERMLRERPMPPRGMGGPVQWRRFGTPRMYVQLLSPQGQVSSYSESLEEVHLPLSEAGSDAVRNGRSWVEIASVEGERLLIYSAPVVLNGRVVEIVQVASSLSNRDRHLRVLGRILLFGSGAALVIAFGAGWLLSGVVLRPIHRITQTAQAIGDRRDLSRRVEYDGPNDELGQLATTFNAMLARLELAYEQQQQFVADVSHELRTPLTTLRGNLGLLRREPPISDADRAEVLSDMVEESERLIRLVNNLLTLARADARRSFQSVPIPVKPLLEEVCRQANLLAPARTITCDAVPDVAVLADRDALKQVLLILLDNALKHTGGDVTVSIAKDHQRVMLSVRDQGPGIEPERLPHIFERFSREPGAASGSNLGLGLAIAKSLVEAQGGTIAVESQVEEGSTFTVSLPQASVHPADPATG